MITTPRQYAVFDNTGKIHTIFEGSEDTAAAYAESGHGVAPGTDGIAITVSGHYVDLSGLIPIVTSRPISPITRNGALLGNVPAGAVLHIDGQQYSLTSGDNTLEFSLSGTYALRVECWPYLDWIDEVTV